MLDSLSPQELCRRYGLAPRKGIGQCFLADPAIVEQLLDRVAVREGDRVVEVGPGLGVLTLGLARAGATLTAIEIDPRLCAFLRTHLSASLGVTVVEADALRFDFAPLPAPPYRLVANLPYHITSPLLLYLLAQGGCFTDLTVMVQKEVAERLLAAPGESDFGRLTLRVAFDAEIEPLLAVPAAAFYPVPKVDSQVIRLRPRTHPPVTGVDRAALFRLIDTGYRSRRKTLANNLKGYGDLAPARLRAALTAADLDPATRAERLALTDWARLLVALARECAAA